MKTQKIRNFNFIIVIFFLFFINFKVFFITKKKLTSCLIKYLKY